MVTNPTDPKTLSLAETAEIVEMSEINMYHSFVDSAPPEIAEKYGLSWSEIGGATTLFMKSNRKSRLFNRVVGLGINEPATEGLIDELMDIYGQANVALRISLSPAAKPAELTDWLLERGFQHVGNIAKMIRRTAPPPDIETDLRLERVNEETAVHAGTIVQQAFQGPDWMASWFEAWFKFPNVYGYLAFQGDVPVGTGGIAVSGDFGSLGAGGTLPEHRRLGAQGAIMARRIQKGIALGCRWLTTETGEDTPEKPNPSYRNMLWTGFHLAYLRPIYDYDPESGV